MGVTSGFDNQMDGKNRVLYLNFYSTLILQSVENYRL